MCQLERIRQMRKEIQGIARKHKACGMFVFGSCARMQETPESDVDFIADFSAGASLFDHAGLELDLADLLGCRVDVVNMRRLDTDDVFSRAVKQEMRKVC